MKTQKNMQPSVLIVHNHYQIPGGEDTVVDNEKRLLEEHGHRVLTYYRDNLELNQMRRCEKLLFPFTLIFNPKTYRQVKKIIEEEKIDIVHVHNTLSLISPSVYYAAISCGIPVVQTVHNFRMLCPGAVFYREGHICEECVEHGLKCAVCHNCYRGSKLQTLACVVNTSLHRYAGTYKKINYICLTEFSKEKLLQLNRAGKKQVINPNKVFIKPNFTYPPEQKKERKRQYYLFFGRVEKLKGIELLLEAFSMLPDQKLMIVGTGSELEYYKEEVCKRKIGNITFTGFLMKEKIDEMLEETKAVVLPSQWYEGFPMTIVESFSHGVPVLGGNIGNIASLVDDGINGIKFRYDSVEALKQAVERFERMDSKAMSKAAYEKYLKEFSEKENYFYMETIYKIVLGRQSESYNKRALL